MTITRDERQAKEFSALIQQAGGQTVEAPLIQIVCKHLPLEQRDQISVHPYTWIFFTSANGVHCFFAQSLDFKKVVQTAHIAAVGTKTAETLKSYGYEADFIPPVFNAETMMEIFLTKKEDVGRWLLIRGNRSRKTIPLVCQAYGIPFHQAEVYETKNKEEQTGRLRHVLDVHSFDYITFTSPSTVDSFCSLITRASHPMIYLDTDIICIGSTTMKRAEEAGFEQIYSAKSFTTQGMVDEMIELERERNVRNE